MSNISSIDEVNYDELMEVAGNVSTREDNIKKILESTE
jgi:hypothetical protein